MKITNKLDWFPKKLEPDGDVFTGLVAIKELNPNYEFNKKMNMPTAEYAELVLPAIYVCSTGKWMSAGRDVTDLVQYWSIPKYPKS